MMSYFSYCSEMWGGTYDSNIKALILHQKRAIQLVCKSSKYDHTNILFSKLSTLKLTDIKYNKEIIVYKACHNFLPDSIQIYITVQETVTIVIFKVCVSTNIGQMSISYHGTHKN